MIPSKLLHYYLYLLLFRAIELSKDKHTLHLVMMITNGIAHNSYYNMIQNEVTMDDFLVGDVVH
jgi:hypothetical protein